MIPCGSSGIDIKLDDWVEQSIKNLSSTILDVSQGVHQGTLEYWLEDFSKAIINQIKKSYPAGFV